MCPVDVKGIQVTDKSLVVMIPVIIIIIIITMMTV